MPSRGRTTHQTRSRDASEDDEHQNVHVRRAWRGVTGRPRAPQQPLARPGGARDQSRCTLGHWDAGARICTGRHGASATRCGRQTTSPRSTLSAPARSQQGVRSWPWPRPPHNHQLQFVARSLIEQQASADAQHRPRGLDDYPEPVTASWAPASSGQSGAYRPPRALAPWPVATVRRAWTTRQRPEIHGETGRGPALPRAVALRRAVGVPLPRCAH